MGGANYMGGKRNFVKARAKDATGKAQRNHFGKQRLGILTKGLSKARPEAPRTKNSAVMNVASRIAFAHAKWDLRTQHEDTSSTVNDLESLASIRKRISTSSIWHASDSSSSTSGRQSRILNALDMSVPITLRAEMDRICSIPNLAGLAPKIERRPHLTDYRTTPESMYASPTNSPPRKKRKLSTSPGATASDVSSPASLSHLSVSSPPQARYTGQEHPGALLYHKESPSTLLDFSDSHLSPLGKTLRRPQYISQISLSHFAHAEPDFEPISLDSSPPRQHSFDELAFSDSLPNLPTRHSSSSTQVENFGTAMGHGRARYPFYGSHNNHRVSPSSRTWLSKTTGVKAPPDNADGMDIFGSSKTQDSLSLSLIHRSSDAPSMDLDSCAYLSQNFPRSCLPRLTEDAMAPALVPVSPERFDDALHYNYKGHISPTLAGLSIRRQGYALDMSRSSQGGSFSSARGSPSFWDQPSPATHASYSMHATAERSAMSPAEPNETRRTSSPLSLPDVETAHYPLPAHGSSDSVVNLREETLYDTLHGQLFEGADPWRVLDEVLGLQPSPQPGSPGEGQADTRGLWQNDSSALVLAQDRETFLPPLLEKPMREADADLDDVGKGPVAHLGFEEPILDQDAFVGEDCMGGASTQSTVEGPLDASSLHPLPLLLGTQSAAVDEWTETHQESHTVNGYELSQCEDAALVEEDPSQAVNEMRTHSRMHTPPPVPCSPPAITVTQVERVEVPRTDDSAALVPTEEVGHRAVCSVSIQGPCLFTNELLSEEE